MHSADAVALSVLWKSGRARGVLMAEVEIIAKGPAPRALPLCLSSAAQRDPALCCSRCPLFSARCLLLRTPPPSPQQPPPPPPSPQQLTHRIRLCAGGCLGSGRLSPGAAAGSAILCPRPLVGWSVLLWSVHCGVSIVECPLWSVHCR